MSFLWGATVLSHTSTSITSSWTKKLCGCNQYTQCRHASQLKSEEFFRAGCPKKQFKPFFTQCVHALFTKRMGTFWYFVSFCNKPNPISRWSQPYGGVWRPHFFHQRKLQRCVLKLPHFRKSLASQIVLTGWWLTLVSLRWFYLGSGLIQMKIRIPQQNWN